MDNTTRLRVGEGHVEIFTNEVGHVASSCRSHEMDAPDRFTNPAYKDRSGRQQLIR
jgi:hypothetical protein